MKAILEFDLPEERDLFDMSVRAASTAFAIDQFGVFLRNKRKYQELTEEQLKLCTEIEEKFWELLNEE